MEEIVLVSACRTPIGRFRGALRSIPAPKLGAFAIREAVHRSGIAPDRVEEVILGNVLSSGLGQAPARQAARHAGLSESVQCLTVNKVCGSGLQSIILASQTVALKDASIVVAGGMESMSNAPFLLDHARDGYRMGNAELIDSMIRDGLTDAYDGMLMGNAAEQCAATNHISREEQDEYAILSYTRAQEAQSAGRFEREIVGVEVLDSAKERVCVSRDEDVTRTDFAKIPALKPAFGKDGTITAASASKISDGAAAVVVTSRSFASQLGVKPLARIVAYASYAKEPNCFPTAPVEAITKVLVRANLSVGDIDCFEINEAFAVVPLFAIRELGLDPGRVNVNGGAIALGHPIGASGARLVVTLLHSMEQRQARYGLATLCIGGGEANAMVVERIP